MGAQEIYDSQYRKYSIVREKFFIIGGIWLVAMVGQTPEKSYQHIAFQVAHRDLLELEDRIANLGAIIVPSRPRVEGEGESIYFFDYDNNLIELHAGTLEERLNRYRA